MRILTYNFIISSAQEMLSRRERTSRVTASRPDTSYTRISSARDLQSSFYYRFWSIHCLFSRPHLIYLAL
ncbi:hypothetical protein QC761_0111900 [Podospora bellae-mahoneyi]|uniref:Uncharacterized protein n=1 Tax=Podospora bellae-mahoneyi TaxID=2093777 RepID=A0ABR0F9G9_9PEZI|nr:hypothetical protein QC761_0111900 [Podospora bellae-mahoneyi]